MKQLLFLLLFPCIALAQYQGNAGQKITLGEQTTADGLVYRGVLADTGNITPFSDTSAYIILDTVNNRFFHYIRNTNVWTRLNLLPSDTTSFNYVNTYGTQTVNGAKTFTSAVTASRFNPTANTATGTGMFLPATNTLGFTTNGTNKMTINSVGNVGIGSTLLSHLDLYRVLQIGLSASLISRTDIAEIGYWSNTFRQSGTGDFLYITSDPASTYTQQNGFHYFTSSVKGVANAVQTRNFVMTIDTFQRVGIGTTAPAVQFHTTGAVRFATFAGGGTTTLSVDNTGNLARTSSIELKKDVTPIRHGLNEILQINPINFNWIDEDKFGNENENGFIAEDVMSIIPNVVASDTHGLFMDYTKLIPILTKAIQEQNALIKALEQRILILENK